jgi:nucleoside phosphorylase
MPIMITEPELVFYVALEEELKVLAKSLGLTKVAGTPQATGKLDGIEVAVICPRNMGRVAAAVAMTDYLAKRSRKPKLILIVGLAGGFPENSTKQGHIIVVTKVVDLALRKVVDDENGASPNFRREDYPLHEQLMNQILSDDLDKDDWAAQACKTLQWPPDRRPSIHCGPMASADEVVASDIWRAEILKGQGGEPKLLGVEMEAGGICEAARKTNVPVCMLRVISDNADPSKADDNWRALGMSTLADLLKHLPMATVVEALS